MEKTAEDILRRRMHGLYLTRRCDDIAELSRELLGLHCWFHRNVAFSALIRGAGLMGWKTALIKTWLYRGTLHGVAPDDLPTLLALHAKGASWLSRFVTQDTIDEISTYVVSLMEDGVYSRAEMRRIFAERYDQRLIDIMLSPWGGIFVELARVGKVAFRNMTSRDFDLIDAAPSYSAETVLPELFRRFIITYGPATLADAALFFGLWRERKRELAALDLDEYERFTYNGAEYFYLNTGTDLGDIPRLTLLSGFDPLIVSYTVRDIVLPPEYKSAVILKSGICLPTVAIDGRIAGLWNIKKGEPEVSFFKQPPEMIKKAALDMADAISWQTKYHLQGV